MNHQIKNLGICLLLIATAAFPQTPAPVVVKNNTLQPIPIRDLGNNPLKAVAHVFRFSIANGATTAETTTPYYVPAGKRLVIEHLSMRTYALNAMDCAVQMTSSLDGHSYETSYGDQYRVQLGGMFRSDSSHPTRIYADGGTWVRLTAYLTPSNQVLFQATFHGYLVDQPLILEVAQTN